MRINNDMGPRPTNLSDSYEDLVIGLLLVLFIIMLGLVGSFCDETLWNPDLSFQVGLTCPPLGVNEVIT